MIMRASEFLKEAVFYKGDYQAQYARDTKRLVILKNPSRSELANLRKRTEYNTVRGFLDSDLLVWDASVAYHADIGEDFGVEGYPLMLGETDFELSDTFENEVEGMEPGEVDEVIEIVVGHPAIRRLYGEVCRDPSGRGFRFIPC
jgi:hypothetical protein